MERQVNYDCMTCLTNKWIEKQERVCYLEKETHELPIPVFVMEDKEGNPQPPQQVRDGSQLKVDWSEFSVEDIYVWLKKMENIFPTQPALDLMQSYLRKVCIEGVLDKEVLQWFRLESAVKAYGKDALELPVSIFNVFEMIRSSENLFENLENFKREAEMKAMNRKK